ncbi:B-cell lymphoma 6 protein homolog isoform X2 [Patella vulgata]|uniref:B-cell lymphoma 6 protein homolog isoform X2 n=1 Tax=Patella vulgata TaxID=6465 RepID=UPI0024A7EC6C|nr:B-cell lymphoma 6 protein homolog isoform X2 [Patella vulgata]
MATQRQKEKTSKKNLRERTKNGNTVRKDTKGSLQRKHDPYESDNDSQSPYMSLDVLAQVATATLEKEPRFESKMPKKLTKRSIQSLEVLNLDQIQALSDKAVISLFADISSNEMTKNFTFKCYLMPEKCKETYTSFGNESRARAKMRDHLLSHIARLIDEANDPDRLEPFFFTAVPVNVRKKRIAEANKKSRSNQQSTSSSGSPTNKKKIKKGIKFTCLKSSKKKISQSSQEDDSDSVIVAVKFVSNNVDDVKENAMHITKSRTIQTITPNKANSPKLLANKSSNLATADTEKSNTNYTSKNKPVAESSDYSTGDRERRIEENEQFIIDLLNRTQPHHDHCYTTIFGKKRGIETISLNTADEEDGNSKKEVTNNEITTYSRSGKLEPILSLPAVRSTIDMPMVCGEEVVGNSLSDDEDKHDGLKPYPPMPKSNPAKKGRISVPEENISYSDGDDESSSPRKKRKLQTTVDSTNIGDKDATVWETKMALKCIRELKARKKDDRVPLVCKICKDKTFTASATLMYHYRSHAGIKPFICLICNTTFTRQHSLNYHMLIHNNQSRFTCKDCGRKFRHPSHFKEHLRRHTGETPFECTDCPLKFKTRNTYKRHLKTRHGKLLTAGGIYLLSKEEFMKVRTKPYKKVPGSGNKDGDSESGSVSGSDGEAGVSEEENEMIVSLPMAFN